MRDDALGKSDSEFKVESGGILLRDFSSHLGESPTFEASGLSSSSVPRFSTLELVNMISFPYSIIQLFIYLSSGLFIYFEIN